MKIYKDGRQVSRIAKIKLKKSWKSKQRYGTIPKIKKAVKKKRKNTG